MKLLRWILDRPGHAIAVAVILFAIATLVSLWTGNGQ